MNTTPTTTYNHQNPIPPEELLLGRYRILKDHSEGGFGSVKVCWDRRLTREVAIKCIPLSDFDDPYLKTTIREALNEARTCSMLSHQNIVTVHDFEIEGNTAYIVMEYLEGMNLEEIINSVDGQCLTGDEAAYILECVSSALTYAHQNNVLHLDIKPANIIVTTDGRVKITDFGMASLSSAAGFADSRGGTVGYMPPEQIEGDLVDERTDIFALGCVMWKALCGKAPFVARTSDASLKKILKGPKPGLSKEHPEYKGLCEDTLKAAMCPDIIERFPSASDMADILVSVLGDPQKGSLSLKSLLCDQEEIFDVPEEYFDKQAPFEHISWAATAAEKAIVFFTFAMLAFKFSASMGYTKEPLSILFILVFGATACCVGLLGVWGSLGLILFSIFIKAPSGTEGIIRFILPNIVLWISVAFAYVSYLKKQPDSYVSMFLPFALGNPLAGAPYALSINGFPHAGFISFFSWFVYKVFDQALVGSTILSFESMVSLFGSLHFWIEGATVLIAMLIASGVGYLSGRIHPVALQLTGAASVIALNILAFWVEYGTLSTFTGIIYNLYILLLFIFMATITVLVGPEAWTRRIS